jgi:hypothetical protein
VDTTGAKRHFSFKPQYDATPGQTTPSRCLCALPDKSTCSGAKFITSQKNLSFRGVPASPGRTRNLLLSWNFSSAAFRPRYFASRQLQKPAQPAAAGRATVAALSDALQRKKRAKMA